jgi:hypothetical protein
MLLEPVILLSLKPRADEGLDRRAPAHFRKIAEARDRVLGEAGDDAGDVGAAE